MGEPMTPEEVMRLAPWEVESLARKQLNSSRFGAESDALLALHLVIALARAVQELPKQANPHG